MKSDEEIEGMLSNYPIIKAEIANLKIDLDILREEAMKKEHGISILGSKSYDYITPGRCTVHSVSSPVEKILIGDVRSIDKEMFEILDKIREKERIIFKIDNILNILKESQRRFIELRYFKGYTRNEMSTYLDVTDATITRRRRVILDKIRGMI